MPSSLHANPATRPSDGVTGGSANERTAAAIDFRKRERAAKRHYCGFCYKTFRNPAARKIHEEEKHGEKN